MENLEGALANARREQQAGNLETAAEAYAAIIACCANQPEALYGLGSIAYRQGKYDKAIFWLRQAVASQPANAILHSSLGAAYRGAGNLAEAELCYQEAMRLQPDFAEAYNNLGNVLMLLGRLDEAAARYQQALLAWPNYAEAHNNLGLVHREQGRWQEALIHFEKSARLQPEFAEAFSNWGAVLLGQGDPDEAAVRLGEAVRLRPGEARYRVNLAAAMQEQGHVEASLAHLREALTLQPELAEAHYSLGIVHLRSNQVAEAIVCFERALELRPAFTEVYSTLGRAYLKQGQLDRATALFQLAPRLQPQLDNTRLGLTHKPEAQAKGGPSLAPHTYGPGLTHKPGAQAKGGPSLAPHTYGPGLPHKPEAQAKAHPSLALQACVAIPSTSSLKEQQKLDDAIAECREVLRLDPDSAEAYGILGSCLARQSKLDEAVTAFQQALRVKPDDARVHVKLGTALREQGRLEKAIAHLRHALKLQTDLADAHRQLGLAFTEQGKPDEAVAAFRASLRLEPDSVLALGHLGILFEEMGQTEEGRVLVEQALRLDPRSAPARAHYGASLVNQGRFEEAKGQFLEALTLDPDYAPPYFFLARDSNYSFCDTEISHIQDLLKREDCPLRDRISLHFALARVHDRAREFDATFHHCHQGNLCKSELLHLQGNAFQSGEHARFVDRLIAVHDREYFRQVKLFGNSSDLPVFIVGMPRSGTTLVEQILASHPAVFGAGELKHLKRLAAELPAELGSQAEYPDCLDRLDQQSACRLAGQGVERLRILGPDKLRITDKMPMNFHYLGLIATLWPKAHIIHCRRDPRDVCWSCYFQNFSDLHFACDLTILGVYYRQYERLMAHWREVLPVPVLEICYEELVDDLAAVSRKLIAFCGLPWHDACLKFYETQRTVRTSSNRQVRRPVYKQSVGYWQNFEAHLGPLFTALAGPSTSRPTP